MRFPLILGRAYAPIEWLAHNSPPIEDAVPGWAQTNISRAQRYMHLDDRELAEAQDLVE